MSIVTQNNKVVVVNGGALTYERPTPPAEKDVNFIDYDGTIVYSYTKTEFTNLNDLPANPSHTGLTSQGWNWTKQQITTQLTAMPDQKVWVGQMYKTTSGKTEIDIELGDAELLTPYLKISVNGTVEVDWGDGLAKDTVTGTSLTTSIYTPHTYATTGNYTISIEVKSGSFTFYNNYILTYTNSAASSARRYNSSIVAVRLGAGITSIGNNAFSSCNSLQSVTIPSGVTSIGNNVFDYCYSLQSVTIPNIDCLVQINKNNQKPSRNFLIPCSYWCTKSAYKIFFLKVKSSLKLWIYSLWNICERLGIHSAVVHLFIMLQIHCMYGTVVPRLDCLP